MAASPGLPVAPSPSTWPLRANSQVWSDDLNGELSNAVTYLSAPPAYSGQQLTTAGNVPTGVNTDVVLETIVYDNYNGFVDTNGKRYNIPTGCGGVWLAVGGVPFNAGSTTANFQALLNLNSGGSYFSGSKFPSANAATCCPLVADLLFIGDTTTVALAGFQNTGVSQNLVNASQRKPFLNLCWVANSTGTAGLSPPSPRTWATNDLCQSSGSGAGIGNFNTEIRNAVRFLAYVPFCRVGQGSAQAGIVTATDTHITGLGPGVGQDNYTAYNTGTDTWTAPVSGTYLIGAQVGWSNVAGASYQTEIKAVVSSVTTTYHLASGLGQANTVFTGLKQLRMTAGDTIQLFGRQNSGGNLSTVASDTRMFILWRST